MSGIGSMHIDPCWWATPGGDRCSLPEYHGGPHKVPSAPYAGLLEAARCCFVRMDASDLDTLRRGERGQWQVPTDALRTLLVAVEERVRIDLVPCPSHGCLRTVNHGGAHACAHGSRNGECRACVTYAVHAVVEPWARQHLGAPVEESAALRELEVRLATMLVPYDARATR